MGTKRERVGKSDNNNRRNHPKKKNKQQSIPSESNLDVDHVEYHSDEEVDTIKQDSIQKHEDDSDSSSSDDDGDIDEINLEQIEGEESDVELTIEFFDPQPDDVTTISMFLNKFASGFHNDKSNKASNMDARSLSETICAQTRVGTCVRLTDEDNPIGFISCLNVREHHELLHPIKRKLLDVANTKEEYKLISEIIKKTFEGEGKKRPEKMGLILCERVVNLPPSVIPKMLEALFCEIEWAVEDEPTEEQRESYKFGRFLYIMDVFVGKPESKEVSNNQKNKKPSKKESNNEDKSNEPQIMYTRVEDEVWAQFAQHSISWSIPSDSEQGDVSKRRMALFISSSKISAIKKAVEDVMGEEVVQEEEEKSES